MHKLSEHQILSIHRWFRQGMLQRDIAERLGVHRNTISDHLNHHVAYPPHLILQIGSAPLRSLPTTRMSIFEAAVILPEQPSKSKIWRMVRSGQLKATRDGTRWYTTIRNVRQCAKNMVGTGLWFSYRAVHDYSSDPELLLRSIRHRAVRQFHNPESRIRYYRAPDVIATSKTLDISVSVPMPVVSYAIRMLSTTGTWVL